MLELNVLDALVAVGQALMLASLIYFFYLVLMHRDLLHRAEGDQGSPRETRPAVCHGEPEHGLSAHAAGVADSVAARLIAGTVPQRFRDSA